MTSTAPHRIATFLPLLFICVTAGTALAQTDGNAPSDRRPPQAGASAAKPGTANGADTTVGPFDLSAADPALIAYLRRTGYLSDGNAATALRTGPRPPVAAYRALYAILFQNVADCGSRGCTFVIVKQSADGAFTLYENFLGNDLAMEDAVHAGARDISVRTENGKLVGRFNGTKYVWSLSREAAAEMAAQTPPPPPAAREISGECIDDRAWHGYATPEGEGAAGFGPCRTNRTGNFLLFACRSGSAAVTVTANLSTRELMDSEPVTVGLSVDGRTQTFNGTAYYDVMNGVVLPELDPVSLTNPIFDSLEQDGTSATITIDGRRQTIHLDGAGDAIRLMRETCRQGDGSSLNVPEGAAAGTAGSGRADP